MTEAHWVSIEEKLRQPDLVGAAERALPAPPTTATASEVPADAPAAEQPPAGSRKPAGDSAARPKNPLLAQLERAGGSGVHDDRPY